MATAFLHHAARQDICTRVSQAFLDLLLRKVCRPPVGFSIMRNQLGASIQCLPSFYFSLFLCKQSWNSLRNAGTLLQRYESCSKLNSASSGMVERMPVSRSACKPYTLGCAVAVRQGGTCWGCDCPLESHQPRSGSAQGLPHSGGGEGSEVLLLVFPIMLEGHRKERLWWCWNHRCGYLRCFLSGLGSESPTCQCSAGSQDLMASLCVSAGRAGPSWPPSVTLQQLHRDFLCREGTALKQDESRSVF